MLWVYLTLLASLLWTIVAIIDKHIISDEFRDPALATVFAGISTFFLFGAASLVGGLTMELLPAVAGILTGIFYNSGIFLYYKALQSGEVSRIIPVFMLAPIFVLLLSVPFLGEFLTIPNYLGIFLLVAGAMLISIEGGKRFKISIAFWFALVSTIAFAGRNFFIKVAAVQAPVWTAFGWIALGGAIVSVVIVALHHPHLRKRYKKGAEHLILNGGLSGTATFVFSLAVSLGFVSLVSALSSIQALFVFLGVVILAELHSKFVREGMNRRAIILKTVSVIMIIAGSFLVI